MSAWLNDLRLAVRTLRAARGFTFAAVLLLALGIAAATTLFSIANALLFRPFPFADQERLGIAGEDQLGPQSEVSYRDVEDWRGGSHVCRRDVDRGGCAGPQNHAQANPSLGTTRRVPDPQTSEARPPSTLRPPTGRALCFGRTDSSGETSSTNWVRGLTTPEGENGLPTRLR